MDFSPKQREQRVYYGEIIEEIRFFLLEKRPTAQIYINGLLFRVMG